MLSLLKIENIAVIESVQISFCEGFNVLTGETGAGKSIIIDAIHMILGERISRDIIRTGEKKASVYAEFHNLDCNDPLFSEYTDDKGTICISREISIDGRNACRINGSSVSTSVLRELGERLVDIHGQHDSHNLLNPDRHIDYLDSFAKLGEKLGEYSACFSRLKHIARELKNLRIDESEKLRRIEMLKFQIEEIELASLSEGEEESLTDRKNVLSNAEKLSQRLNAAVLALDGGEYDGACSLLASAAESLQVVSRITPKFDNLLLQLNDITYSAEEVARELHDSADELVFSPEELNTIEERLDVIYRLKRKYGATVADILEFLDDARKKLSDIELSDETREKLTAEYSELHLTTLNKAYEISKLRKEAAVRISEKIESELRYLDMPNTRFNVEFFSPEDDSQPQLHSKGIDNVEFYMSVNKGESLKALSKTASGGELSRIMLALKNVLAEGSVPVMIFDEIDTGISGRAAQRVAEKLWSVSCGRQVLCVTHLSQLAALADENFLIKKGEKDNRTATSVIKLDSNQRCAEIARINTGENITEIALESAKQQLEASSEYKRKNKVK